MPGPNKPNQYMSSTLPLGKIGGVEKCDENPTKESPGGVVFGKKKKRGRESKKTTTTRMGRFNSSWGDLEKIRKAIKAMKKTLVG